MKPSFATGIYPVLATGVVILVSLGGAYRLSVSEQVEQANADAKGDAPLSPKGTSFGA